MTKPTTPTTVTLYQLAFSVTYDEVSWVEYEYVAALTQEGLDAYIDQRVAAYFGLGETKQLEPGSQYFTDRHETQTVCFMNTHVLQSIHFTVVDDPGPTRPVVTLKIPYLLPYDVQEGGKGMLVSISPPTVEGGPDED